MQPDSPLYLRPRPAVLPWLARFVASCGSSRSDKRATLMREMSTTSLELHAELANEGLATSFERSGTLVACETEPGLEEARVEAAHNVEVGLEAQLMGRDEIHALEPGLAPHVRGGVYYPGEAHCDGATYVRAVCEAAEVLGVVVRTGTEVLRLRRRGTLVTTLETTDGPLTAGTVVLAAGAWAGGLARSAGLFVPVEGGKGYHVEVPAVADSPRRPVFLHETRVVATPFEGRTRFAGTLELSGLDLSVSRPRVAAVERAGRRGFPALAAQPVQRVWRGLRPCSPDGVPIVGRAAGVDNVIVATGHTHMGLALAPVTGRLVGELVRGDPPSHSLALLSPDRFRPLLGLR